MAGALAQQYFGILTRPKTLRDSWLLHGLAGYLRDVWVRKALGRNEVRYRSVCKPWVRLCTGRQQHGAQCP